MNNIDKTDKNMDKIVHEKAKILVSEQLELGLKEQEIMIRQGEITYQLDLLGLSIMDIINIGCELEKERGGSIK